MGDYTDELEERRKKNRLKNHAKGAGPLYIDDEILKQPVRVQPLSSPTQPGRVLIAFMQGEDRVIIDADKLSGMIDLLHQMGKSLNNPLKPK